MLIVKKWSFILIAIFVIALSWHHTETKVNGFSHSLTYSLNIQKILSTKAIGTRSHLERETKLSVSGSQYILHKNDYLLSIIKDGLRAKISNDYLWKIPIITGTSYRIGSIGEGTYCFVDIYLDTSDYINRKYNLSFRLRYRWHSEADFWHYIVGSRLLKDLPYRCEIQLKVYSNKVESFDSQAFESRFEFRNESIPFKSAKNAPPAPWPFEEYLQYAIKGHYKNYILLPTHEYAKHISGYLPNSKVIRLSPVAVIVTVRRRLHLELAKDNGYKAVQLGIGGASNRNQAVLISFDTSTVYKPEILQTYLFAKMAVNKASLSKRLKKRLKNSIKSMGSFSELEIEFERNVASVLEYKLQHSKNNKETHRLNRLNEAFLSDVATVASIARNVLKDRGIELKKSKVSKYKRALNLMLENSLFQPQ